jgi:serine/threonine protein phosphatase PrpC
MDARKGGLDAAGASHTGRRRPHNEDAFGVRPELGLFMVADGVARNAGGAVASSLAVELVPGFLRGDATWPDGVAGDRDDPRGVLVAAVTLANERIHRAGLQRADLHRMATTFAGVLVDGERVAVVHVGDSRVYRLRGERLEALTEDHTFANALIAEGTPEHEALALPNAPMLVRALGAKERVDVSARIETAAPGDVLLLCTDGLHGVLAAPEIAGIILEASDLRAVAERLVARTNERGGPDNVTVVLVRWPGGR